MVRLAVGHRQNSRTTGVLLLVFALIFMGHQGLMVGADPEPTGNGAAPAPGAPDLERIIGNYTHQQQTHNLTQHHAQQLPHGLRVWAHPQAETLQLDPDHLDEQIGPWSTNTPFDLTPEGSIQINQSSALFQPLELGPKNVFTLGSPDTIQFAERPMWVNLTTQNETLQLGLNDDDSTGQQIYIAKTLLHEYDIHRPNATHEDGTELNVSLAPDASGYWIEVPHFSTIVLESADLKVLGRMDDQTEPHVGSVQWNTTTNDLYISVADESSVYELLVEKAWFEAHMPNTALKDHSWTIEEVQGHLFYVVELAPQQTPTTVVFREFRISPDLVYTYGHPELIHAHPFNQTLREERGPMWIQASIDATGIDINITNPQTGPYEVLIGRDWVHANLSEHPVFTHDGLVYPVQPELDLGWLVGLLDDLDLRIRDSATGPLVPPRYERVTNGTITHMDGCGLRHLVHVVDQVLMHEGPACLNTTTLQSMAEAADETHWLLEVLPFSVCAVYFEEQEGNASSFIGVPCAQPLGVLPGFVQDLCNEPPWGDRSQQIFCQAGLSRYHAAGLLLNVTDEAGAVLTDILYFNDHLVEWENLIRANLTLYAQEDWRGAAWKFLHGVRYLQSCHDARPLVFMVPSMPSTVCARAIDQYETGNGTVHLEWEALVEKWTALYETDPCLARESVVVLNGVMDPFCGEVLPLVRDAVDGFVGEVDWQECTSGRGFLVLGLDGGVGGSVCGVVLPFPSGGTGVSWQEVRSLPGCLDEVSFVLYPQGDAPQWLCGQLLDSTQQAHVEAVFSYVRDREPCGVDPALLVVGGDFGAPVVACGAVVGGLGGSWEDDWAQVSGSNPCGGEVGVLWGNVSVGRFCGQDFAVNETAWAGAFDGVSGVYCTGPDEFAVLAEAGGDPVVVCAEALATGGGLEAYWDALEGAWNPCGAQVVWVPANQSTVLGDVGLCGVAVPDLGGLIDDFQTWEDAQGLCGQGFQVARIALVGEPEACGLGPGEDAGLDGLLVDLVAADPCKADEHFLVGFGEVPFALCGILFADLRTIFTGLEELMLEVRPCSLEDLSGSGFCGLWLPDSQTLCAATGGVGGLCAEHSFGDQDRDVLVGYPLPVNETVLWYVGAPGFVHEGGCGGVGNCLGLDQWHGGLAIVGGMDSVGHQWGVGSSLVQENATKRNFPPQWQLSVGSLGGMVAYAVNVPSAHPWLTPELAELIGNGEPIPISEIEGFPETAVDDPDGLAPVPYLHIRPGSILLRDSDQPWCTIAFVFEHKFDPNRLAIGTAGHCVLNLHNVESTILVHPDELVPVGFKFGETIMTSSNVGKDFGLIEVWPEHHDKVDAAISAINGPCGWRGTTWPDNVDLIQYFGHSPFGGLGGQPRHGLDYADHGTHIAYYRFPLGGVMDSGSPVRFIDGPDGGLLQAAAVNTHSDPVFYEETLPSIFGIGTSMPRVVEMIDDELNEWNWANDDDRGKWRLVDSSTCDVLQN